MECLDKLIKLLTPSEVVYIQTHNYPDPDAIAAAFALSHILNHKGLKTQICYFGSIEKFSTRKLVQRLKIEMENVKDIKNAKDESPVILIDSQKNNSNTTILFGKIIASIDHHTDNNFAYDYKDIRPNIGACSTIITEYLINENLPMPEDVATALLFGIKMDTLDFTRRVDILDIKMYAALYGFENTKILDELQKDKLLLDDLKAFSNALSSIKLLDDIGFVNVGNDCPEALLASVSDFILTLEEVNFAIAYSCKKNGIKFSVRSQLDSLDAGKIVMKALNGYGGGGGHKEMAGGVIPRENLNLIDDYIDDFIRNKFLNVIYGED